jgi:hypothetical protein
VLALGEFVGGETVAVCGKGLLDGFKVVGCIEPGLCVDVLLDVFNLYVDGFGNKEVDAVAEVFEEALVGLAPCMSGKTATERMICFGASVERSGHLLLSERYPQPWTLVKGYICARESA